MRMLKKQPRRSLHAILCDDLRKYDYVVSLPARWNMTMQVLKLFFQQLEPAPFYSIFNTFKEPSGVVALTNIINSNKEDISIYENENIKKFKFSNGGEIHVSVDNNMAFCWTKNHLLLNKTAFMTFANNIDNVSKKQKNLYGIHSWYFKITNEHKKNYRKEFNFNSILIKPLPEKEPYLALFSKNTHELGYLFDKHGRLPYSELDILKLACCENERGVFIQV